MSLERFNKQLFNKFLLKASGPTGKAIKYAMSDRDDKTASSAFFQTPKSREDVGIRGQSIITAPLWLAIYSVETLLASVFYAFKSLVDLCMQDTNEATKSIKMSGLFLLTAVSSALAAFVSPAVNLVDNLHDFMGTDPEYRT